MEITSGYCDLGCHFRIFFHNPSRLFNFIVSRVKSTGVDFLESSPYYNLVCKRVLAGPNGGTYSGHLHDPGPSFL